ncbi:cytochrome c [Thiohalobacter sp. IOR34]|uniref:c-type cytochrome n=1 Tax=Thiohalobacter sp. IOR34 TaxID=3057176 RepID=UPI0025B23037|nr:cytochrome c [Thiohalobacter sp. IOR34]WJW76323.1 cytochrome c [Thiohalobacter sp. IOR34]
MRNALIPILLLLLTATAPATAADPEAGRSLHDAHCLRCHDDGVYRRSERRVEDLDGLHRQVRRCEQSLGLRWFDNQLEDVVQYLNKRYYRF